MAQNAVMPLGLFFSPFLTQPADLKKGKYPTCTQCKAGIADLCRKDKNMNKWQCIFCGADNMGVMNFGLQRVEEGYEGRAGDCGMYFIVDQCVAKAEMDSIK